MTLSIVSVIVLAVLVGTILLLCACRRGRVESGGPLHVTLVLTWPPRWSFEYGATTSNADETPSNDEDEAKDHAGHGYALLRDDVDVEQGLREEDAAPSKDVTVPIVTPSLPYFVNTLTVKASAISVVPHASEQDNGDDDDDNIDDDDDDDDMQAECWALFDGHYPFDKSWFDNLLLEEEASITERKRQAERAFVESVMELEIFKQQNGHCKVPQKYPANRTLGHWYAQNAKQTAS